MTKHLFVVTSAINSRFGVYKPAERLEQTIETIRSIKSKIPDAGIAIMECTGVSPTDDQEKTLRDNCNWFLDYSKHQSVVSLYRSTDNWDYVKNGTEIQCFGMALVTLHNKGITGYFDRIHKMSGRYILNDSFIPEFYDAPEVQDKIVISKSTTSQFPYALTQVDRQYMARLWSWPKILTPDIVDVYKDSSSYFNDRLANGGYVDIEHVLYKFLPKDKVLEVDVIGVEGTIAPNGVAIRN